MKSLSYNKKIKLNNSNLKTNRDYNTFLRKILSVISKGSNNAFVRFLEIRQYCAEAEICNWSLKQPKPITIVLES